MILCGRGWPYTSTVAKEIYEKDLTKQGLFATEV